MYYSPDKNTVYFIDTVYVVSGWSLKLCYATEGTPPYSKDMVVRRARLLS